MELLFTVLCGLCCFIGFRGGACSWFTQEGNNVAWSSCGWLSCDSQKVANRYMNQSAVFLTLNSHYLMINFSAWPQPFLLRSWCFTKLASAIWKGIQDCFAFLLKFAPINLEINPPCQAIRYKAKPIVSWSLLFSHTLGSLLFFHLDISLIIDVGILCLISNWFLWFLFCSSPQKTALMCPVKPIYFDLFTYFLIHFFPQKAIFLL